MAYFSTGKKNYYEILGLIGSRGDDDSGMVVRLSGGDDIDEVLRKAYKKRLLVAHPDKRQTTTRRSRSRSRSRSGSLRGGVEMKNETQTEIARDARDARSTCTDEDLAITIDHVKEAYRILRDPRTRAHYDDWLALQPAVGSVAAMRPWETPPAAAAAAAAAEVLDLEDFSQIGLGCDHDVNTDLNDLKDPTDNDDPNDDPTDDDATQWTHPCRCGSIPGFLITQRQLEDAHARRENEVLVGCSGCSLWVRVAFGVE